MKYIQRIKKIFSVRANQPSALGRWNLQYESTIVNRRIDLANEDHCGCCMVPIIEKHIDETYIVPFVTLE